MKGCDRLCEGACQDAEECVGVRDGGSTTKGVPRCASDRVQRGVRRGAGCHEGKSLSRGVVRCVQVCRGNVGESVKVSRCLSKSSSRRVSRSLPPSAPRRVRGRSRRLKGVRRGVTGGVKVSRGLRDCVASVPRSTERVVGGRTGGRQRGSGRGEGLVDVPRSRRECAKGAPGCGEVCEGEGKGVQESHAPRGRGVSGVHQGVCSRVKGVR